MCLAIPALIEEINGKKALADFGGVKREIDVSMLDCKKGDYVLVHVGFAIQKINEETARENQRLLSEITGGSKNE